MADLLLECNDAMSKVLTKHHECQPDLLLDEALPFSEASELPLD